MEPVNTLDVALRKDWKAMVQRQLCKASIPTIKTEGKPLSQMIAEDRR